MADWPPRRHSLLELSMASFQQVIHQYWILTLHRQFCFAYCSKLELPIACRGVRRKARPHLLTRLTRRVLKAGPGAPSKAPARRAYPDAIARPKSASAQQGSTAYNTRPSRAGIRDTPRDKAGATFPITMTRQRSPAHSRGPNPQTPGRDLGPACPAFRREFAACYRSEAEACRVGARSTPRKCRRSSAAEPGR